MNMFGSSDPATIAKNKGFTYEHPYKIQDPNRGLVRTFCKNGESSCREGAMLSLDSRGNTVTVSNGRVVGGRRRRGTRKSKKSKKSRKSRRYKK